MTQVTYQLDHRFPIAVMRVSGELAGRGGDLRAAVENALVEEPTAVILELGGVTRGEESALRTLPELATRAARWPQADLLLAGPTRPVADALTRVGVTARVPLYDGFREALADAATTPVPLRAHRRLEPTVHAPRTARELAAETCVEWQLPGAAVSAEMLASELVTNAVRHAGTAMGLRITLRERLLRISVHDRSPRLARLQTPAESDDHGRGLLIVDSVAHTWGSEELTHGKVVWATLRVGPHRAVGDTTGDLVGTAGSGDQHEQA